MNFSKIATGIGLLILVYLLVKNSMGTTSVINSLATNATAGIKTLQGR